MTKYKLQFATFASKKYQGQLLYRYLKKSGFFLVGKKICIIFASQQDKPTSIISLNLDFFEMPI